MPRVPPVEEATVVAAPTAAVWRAIIDGCDRARWWADLAIEPETRGRVTERWTDDSGVPQLTRGEVVACDEGRLLHFRWADEAWEASTDVELRLESTGGHSSDRPRVRLGARPTGPRSPTSTARDGACTWPPCVAAWRTRNGEHAPPPNLPDKSLAIPLVPRQRDQHQGRGQRAGGPMLEKILFAVDASEWSQRAVPIVVELATKGNGDVRVVHVLEAFTSGSPEPVGESRREAHQLVDDVVVQLSAAGVQAKGEVLPALYRSPARQILKLAEEYQPGVIVLGSQGEGALRGLLLGSLAHKLIHLAHCPVLVVR